MYRKKKQKWNIGDYFLIPLKNGCFGVGQVLSVENGPVKGMPFCAFFGHITQKGSDMLENEKRFVDDVGEPISVQITTPEQLNDGRWKVVAKGERDIKNFVTIELLRENNYLGAKTIGSAIIEDFMNAFHALQPWDMYHKPDYFDNLLLSLDRKPDRLMYKKAESGIGDSHD